MATDTRKKTKAAKPYEALLAAIRDAGATLTGAKIHAAITAAGQPESTWKAWGNSLRDWISLHPMVQVTGSGPSKRYGWGQAAPADVVLDLLARRPLAPEWLREAWREVVAEALSNRDMRGAGQGHVPQAGGNDNPTLRAARELQAKIDVARAVAELAIEVEEIAHNGADSEQIVKRVRSAAALRGLTPIEVAGKDTKFDPELHKLQFGEPKPGMPVFVIKPGYSFGGGDEAIVIEPAVVATD